MVYLIRADFLGSFFINEGLRNFSLFFLSVHIFLLFFLLRESFLLIFLTLMLVVFSFLFFFSWGLISFFVFFELSSLPVVVITLIWGRQIEKLRSVYILLFYSFFLGLPILFIFLFFLKKMFFLNLIFIIVIINPIISFFIILIFFIKFPVYFLHFWLPKIHVESSTFGRILLAGLLLKFGVFGLRRIIFFLIFFNYIIILIRLIGLLIRLFLSLIQRDIKSLIAFTSISHIRLILYLYIRLRNIRVFSGLIIILGHGYIRSLLFWFVGEFFHSRNTRLVYFLNRCFIRSLFFCVINSLISLFRGGFPLRINFISEFLLFYLIDYKIFNLIFLVIYFFFGFYTRIYYLINIFIGLKLNFLILELIIFIIDFFFLRNHFFCFL